MRLLRTLATWVDGLNDRLGLGIRWLVLIMVLTGAVSTVARYFSRDLGLTLNLTPAAEMQWYLFSTVFLLGSAYGLRQGAHVRVDILYERFNARTRAWIDFLGTAFLLIPFAVFMLWVSFPAVQRSWQIRETSPDPGGLPRYPIKALILVSFALLLLQALSQMVKHVDVIRGDAGTSGKERSGPEPHA